MPTSANDMKQAILIAALICAACFAKAQTPPPREIPTPRPLPTPAQRPIPPAPPTPPPGVVETYKVVNGMNIRATVYNVDDGRTHRVVIVIHGGGYIIWRDANRALPKSFRSMDSWA